MKFVKQRYEMDCFIACLANFFKCHDYNVTYKEIKESFGKLVGKTYGINLSDIRDILTKSGFLYSTRKHIPKHVSIIIVGSKLKKENRILAHSIVYNGKCINPIDPYKEYILNTDDILEYYYLIN